MKLKEIKIVFLIFCLLSVSLASAQQRNKEEEKDFFTPKVIVSAGFGLPSFSGIGMYFLALAARSEGYNADVSGFLSYYLKGEVVLPLSDFTLGFNFAQSRPKFSSEYVGFSDPVSGVYYDDRFYRTLQTISTSYIVRLNYHFDYNSVLDSYIGIGTGFRHVRYKYTDTNKYGKMSDLGLSFTAFPVAFEAVYGMRYLINDQFGIYGEVGLAKSFIQGGIVARF